jgi:hypothetical protein
MGFSGKRRFGSAHEPLQPGRGAVIHQHPAARRNGRLKLYR